MSQEVLPPPSTPQGFVGVFRRWFAKEFGDQGTGIHLATDLRVQLQIDQLGWVSLARTVNEEYGLDMTADALRASTRTVKDLFEVVIRAYDVKKVHVQERKTAKLEHNFRRNSMERLPSLGLRKSGSGAEMAGLVRQNSASSLGVGAAEVLLMMDPLQLEKHWFMGLDMGTQSLKLIVMRADGTIVKESSVTYDAELPQFGTNGGVCASSDGRVVTAPTLMWVAALDLLLEKLKKDDFAFENVVAISGGGQQHGSVYWNKSARQTLKSLDDSKSLQEQLKDAFSTPNSPVWMDSSTDAICCALEDAVGGAQNLADMTGSRAYERFTGAQMAKICMQSPEVWEATARVSLVSSFLASLFLGAFANIDHGDGSGMNLMDIRSLKWVKSCLDFVGSKSDQKLGDAVAGWTVQSNVSTYLQRRYGFSKTCIVSAFTGDNLNSLASLRLGPGALCVSLGTSDTVFGTTSKPRPSGREGHIFCSPVSVGEHVGLVCFSNGAFAREAVRNDYAKKDWQLFNDLVLSSPPKGSIFLKWVVPEITPPIPEPLTYYFDAEAHVMTELEPGAVCRAFVETQMIRLKAHALKLGLKATDRIVATGGASNNKAILQVMADVFGVPVYISLANSASAALGACFRALHAYQRKRGAFYSFESATAHLASEDDFQLVARPREEYGQIYSNQEQLYEDCLGYIMEQGEEHDEEEEEPEDE